MPGFDGTGPRGMGPMTGGGRGYCSPWGIRAGWPSYGVRGWAGYGYGYGYPGRGFGQGYVSREQEMEYLKSEAETLKRTLEGIEARIRDLAEKGK